MDFDYRKSLREELKARKQRNEAYSLRAYARDLNISLTALHEVIHLKRHFSRKNLEKVRFSLSWSEEQFENANATIKQKFRGGSRGSDWHHHAILNLSNSKCPADPKWIGDRLGLDPASVLSALDRLLRTQMVAIRNGLLIRQESLRLEA